MINIIGLGPGNLDYITKKGENLISTSDVLIGGKRNLESIKNFEGEKIVLDSNLREIIEYINNNKEKQISIIASGDPLIYGIGRYLSKNIDNKNKEIKELKNDNKHLQEMVDYFKNLFRRLVKFIKNKMFGKEKEREDYWKVSKDMYEHGIFSDETIESIKDDYVWNKENDKHKDKGRDDFEL